MTKSRMLNSCRNCLTQSEYYWVITIVTAHESIVHQEVGVGSVAVADKHLIPGFADVHCVTVTFIEIFIVISQHL